MEAGFIIVDESNNWSSEGFELSSANQMGRICGENEKRAGSKIALLYSQNLSLSLCLKEFAIHFPSLHFFLKTVA